MSIVGRLHFRSPYGVRNLRIVTSQRPYGGNVIAKMLGFNIMFITSRPSLYRLLEP